MTKRKETNKIILHCSASDRPEHDNVETIATWHKERGFISTGYHLIITKDGNIHTTDRNLADIGAHCRGHNADSVGICLTGDKFFSLAQFHALRIAIDSLYGVYPHLNDSDVYPHNHFNKNKTCPNFNLNDIL